MKVAPPFEHCGPCPLKMDWTDGTTCPHQKKSDTILNPIPGPSCPLPDVPEPFINVTEGDGVTFSDRNPECFTFVEALRRMR